MSAFPFVYDYVVDGALVHQFDAQCRVDQDGVYTLYFEALNGRLVEVPAEMAANVNAAMRLHHEARLAECRAEIRLGAIAHDRALAADLRRVEA